jgi:SAM-dependent methyltransferase
MIICRNPQIKDAVSILPNIQYPFNPVQARPVQNRLDLNHKKYFLLLDQKHCLAPIAHDVHNVLDIGCGTGLWCSDFANNFQSANVSEHIELSDLSDLQEKVIGIDIAIIQPELYVN